MKLTSQTNYAIQMLMYCHTKDGLATVGEISDFYGLSEKFLTKILGTLTLHNFVETVRGRSGGIRLARAANQIFIGDVVRKVEKSFELSECFKPGHSACPLVKSCGLNHVLSRALQGFFDILNEYTVEDLTQNKFIIREQFENMLSGTEVLGSSVKG